MKSYMLPMTIVAITIILFVNGSSFAQCCEGGKAKADTCLSQVKTDTVQEAVTQTKCPVMGGDINKEVFVDYKGKRIYFCCKACIETFNKDPEKYLKKMKEDGIKLEDVSKKT